jgi:hypothetical protein
MVNKLWPRPHQRNGTQSSLEISNQIGMIFGWKSKRKTMHDSSSPYGKKNSCNQQMENKGKSKDWGNHYHAIITHQKPFKTYFENVKNYERPSHGHSHFCIDWNFPKHRKAMERPTHETLSI